MAKAQLVKDLFALNIRVDEVYLGIDESTHRQTKGGFETLGKVRGQVEETFDQLALTVSAILDAFPGDSVSMELHLESLKAELTKYFLRISSKME